MKVRLEKAVMGIANVSRQFMPVRRGGGAFVTPSLGFFAMMRMKMHNRINIDDAMDDMRQSHENNRNH